MRFVDIGPSYFIRYYNDDFENLVSLNSFPLHQYPKAINVRNLYFYGVFSKEGNDAKVMLVSIVGVNYKFKFRLNFDYTNNMVEYEALLFGLNMASNYGIVPQSA